MTVKRADFLDEIIAERTAQNPEFPGLVEADVRRREQVRQLPVVPDEPAHQWRPADEPQHHDQPR